MTTINSRETYLKYRADWKAEYKELSTTIRKNKALMKDGMRKHFETAELQNDLRIDRERAHAMLIELAEVKEQARQHSAKQRAARREAMLSQATA